MSKELKNIAAHSSTLLLILLLITAGLYLSSRPQQADIPDPYDRTVSGKYNLKKRGRALFQKLMCDRCHSLQQREYQSGGVPWMNANTSLWIAYFYSPSTIHHSSSKPNYRTLLKKENSGRYNLTEQARILIKYLSEIKSEYPDSNIANTYKLQFSNSSLDGRQLYKKLCLPCHGDTGLGNGPLAKILPNPPRNLTRLQDWKCTSSPSGPSSSDLTRTLFLQLAGCGTPDIKEFLSPNQIEKLLKYLNTLTGVKKGPEKTQFFNPPKPTQKELDTPEFHHWKRALWQFEYRLALEFAPKSLNRQLYPLSDWRDWRERVKWMLFETDLKDNPIDLSPAGWEAELFRQPHFKSAAEKWLSLPKDRPKFSEYLKDYLRNILKKQLAEEFRRVYPHGAGIPWWNIGGEARFRKHWLKTELNFRWKGFIRRQQFREYLTWRRVKEKELFKKWDQNFTNELYSSFIGEKIFKQKSCIRCHNPYQRAEIFVKLSCGNKLSQIYNKLKFGGGEKFRLYHRELLRKDKIVTEEELYYLTAYIRTLYRIKEIPLKIFPTLR